MRGEKGAKEQEEQKKEMLLTTLDGYFAKNKANFK